MTSTRQRCEHAARVVRQSWAATGHARFALAGRASAWAALLAALSACSQLASIPYEPRQTPESWLRIQPYAELTIGPATILVVQPTSSAIVFVTAALSLVAGLRFLHTRMEQRSRWWWGIALLLLGIAAVLAGTSYEAFSYQIKCAGRETCMWTSGWEVGYLVLSAAGVGAIVIAQAYASLTERWRTLQMAMGIAVTALFIGSVLAGAFLPVKFLLSFEWLALGIAPCLVLAVIQNAVRYRRARLSLDLALLRTWVGLALTIGAYALYARLDLTSRLWAHGVWFSENDVLHIGLAVVLAHVARRVSTRMRDAAE